MIKIATPISGLFEDPRNAEYLSRISDCLECRDHTLASQHPQQKLFHCELQPIHIFSEDDFAYLEKVKKAKPDLELVSFHAACSCKEHVVKEGVFYPQGNCFTESEMQKNARENFQRIREIFGKDVMLAIENNNYYPTLSYQFVTDPKFLQEVVSQNDILFLLDIAHAKVTAHNSHVPLERYLQALPLDKVVQIHICTPAINAQNLAYDAHLPPNREMFSLVKELVVRGMTKFLTIEYYKDVDVLADNIEELKTYVLS